MKPDGGKTAIPDLLLERYRLNEVSAAERAEIERGIREDEKVRRRLAEIEQSDEAIRETGFASSLATDVRARAVRDARLRVAPNSELSARVLRRALPLAVGVTAMVVVVVAWRGGGLSPDSSGDRIKGLRPSLTMFRQTPRGSEALADGAGAREGDVVRLAYQAAGQSYGVIVSIDGRGGVTVHLPPTGREAARLRSGDRVLLDQAYELDDAPRWECFYFVTGQEPFDAQPVIEAAKREGVLRHDSPPSKLALPRGLQQSMFALEKEHRP